MNPRLLDLLVKENLLTSDQAQKAVTDQRRSGERLATVLTRLAFITEEELLDFLSRKYGIPVINLGRVEADPDILRLVRKEIVQKYQVFPVRKVGNTLTLALSDPTVVLAIDDVQFATGLHVIPVLAAESAIRARDRPQLQLGCRRYQEAHRPGVHRRRHQPGAGRQGVEGRHRGAGPGGGRGPDDPLRQPDHRRRDPQARLGHPPGAVREGLPRPVPRSTACSTT